MNLFNYTYDLVRQIPPGMISTYGAVANALGDIRAARAVGRMMNQNPDADTMPCFKIVYSGGGLGGFGLGIDDKIRRLKEDNIHVDKESIIDFDKVFFNDFKTEFPLKKLRSKQEKLSKLVKIEDSFDKITTVTGFDVAYPSNEFEECCCASVTIDYNSKEIVEERTHYQTVDFPYIPTYLTYRELPLIQNLFKKLKIKPSILLIDGNGILHPARFGIASHIGVTLDIPTIGVAKSLLTGKVKNNIVEINGEKRGYTFFSSNKIKKPIYVSPGHKISFESSIEIVKKISKYKIPKPLRLAHILATNSV